MDTLKELNDALFQRINDIESAVTEAALQTAIDKSVAVGAIATQIIKCSQTMVNASNAGLASSTASKKLELEKEKQEQKKLMSEKQKNKRIEQLSLAGRECYQDDNS